MLGSRVEPFKQFWKELKRSASKSINLRILSFYGTAVMVISAFSLFLPYQTQVYLSIGAGISVAILLATSMMFSRSFMVIDVAFIGGIAFLLVALFKRGLLPRTALENLGHMSLIVSVAFTGSYVVLLIVQSSRIRLHVASVKSLNDFLSVCFTTLSSELCSCLHPIPFLDALGIIAFLENRVRLGFVIMMTTLAHQTRLAYEFYKSRRRK